MENNPVDESGEVSYEVETVESSDSIPGDAAAPVLPAQDFRCKEEEQKHIGIRKTVVCLVIALVITVSACFCTCIYLI